MSGDLFDIRGRVALITGANAGIGLGYAEAIASRGGDVVIWGRRADRNEEARKKLAAHGGRVLTDVVDVADEEAQIRGFEKAIAEMGQLDCVIANAGFMSPSGFKDMSFEHYHALVQVAQHGAFITLREAVKHMVARADAGRGGGSLIATGSLSNFQAVPRNAHYAAAKCAVAAMIKTIAVEYAALGIRANMVCAGLIASETVPADLPQIAELGARAPIGRIGQPEDLAGIVVYLMSDAAKFHTGDLITVDGGAMASLYY
jgi:NAD(P)-dependent dehydrogenase (short-subunit alcohol dehydrogenase family)